jgi:hypothetical protein
VPTNCNGDPITCPVVLNLLAKPRFALRRSGSVTTGFLEGERKLDGAPFKVTTTCPEYLGQPSGRVPTDDEKRGAWQLQEEYLTGRLGKNEEENGRNWNTAIWIAIGRQRVIEGLRIAESIRKGLSRQERPFSMWQNQIRARQIQIKKPGLTAARRQASVDEIIKAVLVATTPVISMPMIGDYEPVEIWQDNDSDTLTRSSITPVKSLPMPVRAPVAHYWNQAAGPVIKLPDNPLPANDSFPFDTFALAA